MIWPLVKYVLLAAARDKLILSMLIVFAVASSLAIFLGDSAITEKDQFTLIFAASGLRIISVIGLVLFVVFFVRRSFDSKDIEFLLSRPVGRVNLIFSYALAFSIMSLCVGIAVGFNVWALAPHLFDQGHIVWVASVISEQVIMVNTAFFFAMYISSAASASMATMGVYVLGRLMGQLLGIIDSPLVDSDGLFAMALQLVSVITPRLDLLGQTSWLIYGVDSHDTIIFAIVQGAVFSLLVLSAASLDFFRRQF